MTTQGLLFHPNRSDVVPVVPQRAAPYVAGSRTSAAAARSIAGRSKSMQDRVLEFFKLRGQFGGTDQEIANFLRLPENSIRPRRIELVQIGLVCDSGKTRLTKSRRSAVVWIIAPAVATDVAPAGTLPF